ncbi:LysR family transcriptional regulator [Paraburkholderia bannensis]|uniref:LysR family transcriptional regulator n=1 Tax=Paraburkholderia bannensis TaxID=765414 RepID=UPI002AB222B3|nr:LysR family transcriptional regulator [Paraburkholderia bannensis]
MNSGAIVPKINYDLPDLRALCEVAKQGGFNRAADTLAITPSALSRRIAKIESAIGGLIVERTTRAMELTLLGKRLLSRAEPLLAALDACMEDAARVAKGLDGEIAVGCVATIAYALLPKAVTHFKSEFPDVRVRVSDNDGPGVLASVLSGDVEFAVTTTIDAGRDLDIETIAADPLVLACSSKHPLAKEKQITWSQLKPYRLLGFRSNSATRKLIDSALASSGIELSWFYQLDLLSTFVGHLRSGEFISPVPRLLASLTPDLAAIPLVRPEVKRQIYLVQRRGYELGLPALALREYIKSCVQEAS